MSAQLRHFISDVAAANAAAPDAETITIRRAGAVEAARRIVRDLRAQERPKRGRPITRHDRKAETNRARVRLHRDLLKGR